MNEITLDYAGCLSDRVREHGIDGAVLETASGRLDELTARLNETKGTGWERWRGLPFEPMRSGHLDAVRRLADRYRADAEYLIVLGIGGSALGNAALQSALNPATYNLMDRAKRGGPRIFVLDNVDPEVVGATLEFVRREDPTFERTVLNVISKSGETAETAAQFMVARSMMKAAAGAKYAERVVAITDEAKGTMREICDAEGYATLQVPEGVGGRFSALSPVGLFSAAMCGIDVEGLLDGAAAMDEWCSEAKGTENPAATLAWLLMEFAKRGKPNHVLMPYCNGLYLLADWYRQLWAESLGKRHDKDGRDVFAGATPIKALGATDQHSQIQLYREGPNDKVIGFVEVERFRREVEVPSDLDVANLRYLQGKTLGALLNAEKRATEYALMESERPNFTIRMPEVNERSVGAFMQLWMIATAYAGLMLGIDAYDQPAVETGKQATFGLMGRAGYEEWKTKVEGALEDRVRA